MKSVLTYLLFILAFIGFLSMSMQIIMIWNMSDDPYIYAAFPEASSVIIFNLGVIIFAIGWPVVYLIWRKMK